MILIFNTIEKVIKPNFSFECFRVLQAPEGYDEGSSMSCEAIIRVLYCGVGQLLFLSSPLRLW